MGTVDNTLGLYLSVPFCKAKCTFCNFASDAYPPARMAAYVDRVIAEIGAARDFASPHGLAVPSAVDSIFLGGGTPSLLEPQQMTALFGALRDQFQVFQDAEITVEAAPGQISDALLDSLLKSGVNRISLGVQSFVDAESRAVGRSHTGASCLAELERLRAAGVRDLNVDLIAGLPHQTVASWSESLQQAIESSVDHVSVYMLEVDEDSRLGRELIGPGVRYGANATPADSLVADLYSQACEALNGAGLTQYEISNFARAGHTSRHNLKYWTRAPYLGFGLDAHSMLLDAETGGAVRFANADDLDGYMDAAEAVEVERVDALEAWEESIFLGLRLSEGVSIDALRRDYPAAWVDAFVERSRELAIAGFMSVDRESVRLTQNGRILSSSVFGELLAIPAA
ncbi:putative oxygen-independent coproporphyrinogen III oxidase [Terriglobus roseus DSM 18391]|uniref:Heme chaperone HemW n=1 Tax=Terriglobus roseus (strain DSM 18391 / NRRL B-41598 / KBS 63) TaxID=926566 RepID=I3ZH51_TERRK|nr:radical SAM family heme chaperone HemW [Terriglobus roseus]AFL88569.1 putative oxygen-independent coproporphyrinogen III oxidase [Terriglobus roseus DSM 18391]AFL88910.1 putative oxygen-independent coproporphyrinogen III oxidase [Terriglobus roseus DSM 18391]